VIALCGALAFAELGGMYHGSGAQYDIVRDSYGPMLGFLFVFCIATVIEPGSIGVMAVICSQNLLAVFDASPGVVNEWTTPLSVALILLLAGANILGARWGATIGNVSVFAKVFALLAVVGLAMYAAAQGAAAPAATQPVTRPASGVIVALLACMVPVLFSYGGWQQVLWVAGEVRNPRRSLPLSIVLGVVIVIVVYLLANWAYLRLLGVNGVAMSETLAADAVGAVIPNLGRQIVAAAVAVSAFGVLNVQFLTAPRLIYGLAADGRFFKPFATINPRFRTPIPAMALLTVFSLIMLLAAGSNAGDKLDRLLTAVVMVDGVFFVLTGLAVIVLRHKKREADRPLRVPGYPLVPILFALGELGVIVGSYVNASMRTAALISAAWVVAGVAVYFAWFRVPSGSGRRI
jgi:APA family basic amino acid/polyamine antiporter